MPRTGISLEDVRKARDAILLAGGHPSIDAIRSELGHTGSKTTISRHLKALEAAESRGQRPKVAIDEALQALVSQLADKLRADAELRVAEARQRFEAAVVERDAVLATQRQEAAQLSTQLQRVLTELQGERLAHADTRQTLLAATADSAQLRQHNVDLQQRLADHEHQNQQLQLDLRTLNQTLIVKQQELSTAQQEQCRQAGELAAWRSQVDALQTQLAQEREAAQRRFMQLEASVTVAEERQRQSRCEAENVRQELAQKHEALRQAELTNTQLQAKLGARQTPHEAVEK